MPGAVSSRQADFGFGGANGFVERNASSVGNSRFVFVSSGSVSCAEYFPDEIFRTSSGSVAYQDQVFRMNERLGVGGIFPSTGRFERGSDDLIRTASVEQNRGRVEIQVFRR